MPTTAEEVAALKGVIDIYLPQEQSRLLFGELYVRVGAKSENESVRLSLLMLREIYDGRSPQELEAIFTSYRSRDVSLTRRLLWAALILVVVSHIFIIFAHLAALLILPILTPWYVALPLAGYIVNLVYLPGGCVLTKLEDAIRRKLGLPEVKKFIKHYSLIAKELAWNISKIASCRQPSSR